MEHWDETRRRVAKQLYGRPVRVALAVWILERAYSPFYLSEAQQAVAAVLGHVESAVGQEVALMCETGLLNRVPDGRRVYFVPIRASRHWVAFGAIAEALGMERQWRDGRTRDESVGR